MARDGKSKLEEEREQKNVDKFIFKGLVYFMEYI